MLPNALQKLLAPKKDLHRILNGLLPSATESLSIVDTQGRLLYGNPTFPSLEKAPIVYEEQLLGWVHLNGQSALNAVALAELVAYLAGQEAQKKSLAAELVERYRELNLHYHLTERLSAAALPEPVAQLAIEEALHLIPAATGLVLLTRPGSPDPIMITLPGQPPPELSPCCLVEQALANGKTDLANMVSSMDYFPTAPPATISLLCAPLKTEKVILGVILLVRQDDQVFSAGDLKLLNTIAMQTAPAIEISRLYQVAVEKARFERELQMARQVQESLLPQEIPELPGWHIAARWRPAREVSGDFYDVIEEAPDRLGLVIADVTDKGMPASLFMVFARGTLRTSLRRSASPAEAITYANQVICQDSHEGLFATFFYARLQVKTGQVCYVNGGHNPPLHYQARTGEVHLLARTGLPLGVDEEAHYTDQVVQLEHGDFILFYTDGITEAINPAEEEYGLERLQTSLARLSALPAGAILDGLERDLAAFTASASAADDLTLMVLQRE